MSAIDKDGNWHESPVNGWFGLTYASYLVLPRVLMEAMPYEWQVKAVGLLEEMRESLDTEAMGYEDRYAVNLRGKGGRFKKDPFAQYRRPIVDVKFRDR